MVVRDSFTGTEITVMNDCPPQDAESISTLHNTFKKSAMFQRFSCFKRKFIIPIRKYLKINNAL